MAAVNSESWNKIGYPKNNDQNEMVIITINTANYLLSKITHLYFESKVFQSRSEIVRHALFDFMLDVQQSRIEYISLVKDLEKNRVHISENKKNSRKALIKLRNDQQNKEKLEMIKKNESNPDNIILEGRTFRIVKNKAGRTQ